MATHNMYQHRSYRIISTTTILLSCGILSSLLYIAINIYVPTQWDDYNSLSQTVSELSAIGAPTQLLWIWLCTPYSLLVLGFAWGVYNAAYKNHRLQIAGKLMIAYALLGFFWPFAPMHLRQTLAEGGGTFSDTMHIILSVITETLFFLVLWFTARSLTKQFKIYSIFTAIVFVVFGALTFLDAPKIALNQPTPFIGLWERINIGVFMLWMILLAITLIKQSVPDNSNKI